MDSYDPDYYKKYFKDKFLEQLNLKYFNIPPHKRRGQFYDDYEECYYTNIRETARNWFRTDFSKREVPTIWVLINICNLLHCDIDYFLTTQEKYNSDIEPASITTGLTTRAIENLMGLYQNIKPQSLSVLNYLLGENPQKGGNLLFFLYHYLFGNYKKIEGFDNYIVDLVDDTGFGGVALDISDLNAALKTMIDEQIYSIKTDIDAKWKDYGKNIPTKEEAEHIIKATQVEIDLANQNIEKFKSDEKKQDFWKRRLVNQEEIMKKYRHLLETKYKK